MKLSKITSLLGAAVWLAASVATPALAHDEATLDAMASAHGGQLRMAGIYHFELVVAPATVAGQGVPVQVYVTDHLGQKISTAQASGSVSFLSGKTRTQVSLSPQGDNALVGTLAQAPKHGTQALVSIAPEPGQAPLQAKFTRLLAKPVAGAHSMPGSAGKAEMPMDATHQH
jgi:hypothetical protein